MPLVDRGIADTEKLFCLEWRILILLCTEKNNESTIYVKLEFFTKTNRGLHNCFTLQRVFYRCLGVFASYFIRTGHIKHYRESM